jgi:hypothetical protein
MPQRCAAQDRCDAASGWVDLLLPSRGRVNPRATSAEGECCAWPSTPSYMLFVTITDGKLMSGGGCPRAALGAIAPTVLRSFRFLSPYVSGVSSLIASIMRVVGFQRHQPPRRHRVREREPLRDPIAHYSLLNHRALTYATNAASAASVVW